MSQECSVWHKMGARKAVNIQSQRPVETLPPPTEVLFPQLLTGLLLGLDLTGVGLAISGAGGLAKTEHRQQRGNWRSGCAISPGAGKQPFPAGLGSSFLLRASRDGREEKAEACNPQGQSQHRQGHPRGRGCPISALKELPVQRASLLSNYKMVHRGMRGTLATCCSEKMGCLRGCRLPNQVSKPSEASGSQQLSLPPKAASRVANELGRGQRLMWERLQGAVARHSCLGSPRASVCIPQRSSPLTIPPCEQDHHNTCLGQGLQG